MTSRGTPSSEPDGLRERILRASITLLEEEGLAALSFREVARRAGVSHQAPYHYFADREAILGALAERGFAMLRAAMQEACGPEVGATEAVERAILAYVQFAYSNPAHFRLMFRPELVSLKDHAGCQAMGSEAFKYVPGTVMGCMQAGFPDSLGVDVMSALFWSIAHGLASLLLDGPLAETLSDFMKDQKLAIAQVARALRLMVEATIAQEAAKPSTPNPKQGARRRPRRTSSG